MHILVYEHLRDGRLVHDQLIQSGYKFDVFEGTGLVDMYAKCGSIEDAWRVFNKMPSQDVITRNTMILGYVKCGRGQKALEIFRQMQQEHACNQTLFLLWAC
jgi:pentatricopeptide repeat protein